MFTLKVSQKSGPEEVLNFSEGEVHVGRVRGNEIVLPKSNISKRHAMFTHNGSALAITDTKSTNGTFVNGDRISGVKDLGIGDKVFLGDFTIEVIDLAGAPAQENSKVETKNHKSQPNLAVPDEGSANLLEQVLDDDDWSGQSGFEGEWNDDWSIAKASADDISIDPLEAATNLPKSDSPTSSEFAFGDETGEMTGADAPNVIIPPAPPEKSAKMQSVSSPFSAESSKTPDSYTDGASTASIVEAPELPDEQVSSSEPPVVAEGLGGLHAKIAETLELEFYRPSEIQSPQFRQKLESTTRELAQAMLKEGHLDEALGLDAIIEKMTGEYTAHGPLLLALSDPSVTEIHINGFEQLFVSRGMTTQRLQTSFISEDSMIFVFSQLLGLSVVEFLDGGANQQAHTKDGLLVMIQSSPSTPTRTRGRIKRLPGNCDAASLASRQTMSEEMAAFLQLCMESRQNILLSLAPGADGSEIFQYLANVISDTERLVSIQDVDALDFKNRNGVHLSTSTASTSLDQVFRQAAMENPSRLFIDTALGQSAVTVTELIATRYRGSVMAIHTSSPDEAAAHLVRLCQHAGISSPAAWTSTVVDFIVQVTASPEATVVIESISEVAKAEGERTNLIPIFVHDTEFTATGAIPQFCERDVARERATELSLFTDNN